MFTTNDSDFDGQVQALASDARYLFAIVDNGTKLEILAGLWEIVEGYHDWRWHPIAEIPATFTNCETAFFSTVVARRLWLASTTASEAIYYIPIPANYGNIAADTTISFKSGGYLITPYYHANLKGDVKAWYTVTLTMIDVDATNYWSVSYQKWGDSSWTSIGDFGKDEATTKTLYIPVDASDNEPQSIMMRFKITCTSDGAQPAPRLLNMDIRGSWWPTKRKLINCRVRCADNLPYKNEGVDREQTEKIIRDFLNAEYSPTTKWPIDFYPPYYDGKEGNVKVKIIDPFEMNSRIIEKGNPPKFEYYFDLNMEVVTLA